MAITYNGTKIDKIVYNGTEIFGGGCQSLGRIVARIQGGEDKDPGWQQTKFISGVKAYSLCSAVQAYSCGGKLEGYINGKWETIADFKNTDVSKDKGGNGGGNIQFGYMSGLITKNYTNYRVSAKSSSVYPSFCVCEFFGGGRKLTSKLKKYFHRRGVLCR